MDRVRDRDMSRVRDRVRLRGLAIADPNLVVDDGDIVIASYGSVGHVTLDFQLFNC